MIDAGPTPEAAHLSASASGSPGPVRRGRAVQLAREGRFDECVRLCHAELLAGEDGVAWMSDEIVRAMHAGELRVAGDLAAVFAALRLGTAWYPPPRPTLEWPARVRQPEVRLSIPKLQHDADQFRHLRRIGALGPEFDEVIADYEDIAARLRPLGINRRAPLEPADEARIGRIYGRIVHIPDTPRLSRVLSPTWDRAEAERCYVDVAPGIVVIDDFLTEPALQALRRFCLEATVWSGNRYADGRLGAFFFLGFNCPLLVQVAEEIREALPRVIGTRHTLRQLWGFKYSPHLPADSTIHADFAAVNVNFWITPDDANLDPSSGGMVVYDVDAPPTWEFHAYNRQIGAIRELLRARGARAVRIPYRCNRAVIFNSDLFHATEEVRFRPGYADRRVNITMLYGVREGDDLHPPSADADAMAQASVPAGGWRSAAFAHARRR